MVTIESEIEINAARDKVWDIVSDLDGEPKYWKGTKETRIISKKESTIKREITIAFRDQKCLQEVTLFPKEKIETRFIKGIIDGTKIITLVEKEEKTLLQTRWDIKLTGMMGIFTGMIKKHIKGGTEQALQNIKKEAEQ